MPVPSHATKTSQHINIACLLPTTRRTAAIWLKRLRALVVLACMIFPPAAAALGCDRPPPGSPEAVADAFADAYFHRADQAAAKAFTAFGASKMLDQELAEVQKVREGGFSPSDAELKVTLKRGERSERGHRVRFQYTLSYQDGDVTKYADVELSKVADEWKVVRVGLANNTPPPVSS